MFLIRSFLLASFLLVKCHFASALADNNSLVVGVFRAEAKVLGSSAIVDKETGRIFWEGGSSSTLGESLAPKIHAALGGIPHLKATLLTALLLFFAAGTLAELLRDLMHDFFGDAVRPYVQTALLSFTRTMLRLPKFPRWFVVATCLAYLMEAYLCSTRQYLAHAVDNVEACIAEIRATAPVVEWRVRSFHYETLIQSVVTRLFRRKKNTTTGKQREHPSSHSVVRAKVVTHTAKGSYQYNSCQDRTIAGVWKRANAVMQQKQQQAPFTKIMLTTTLVLKDGKARQDYLRQQSNFVKAEHSDAYAEFSTRIQVPGFEPRLLSVRNVPVFRLHRQSIFWAFTLVGLTVPYRRWFAAHCDEVRVTVVKETGTDVGGWFSSSKTDARTSDASSPFCLYDQEILSAEQQNETAALVEEGLQAASILAMEQAQDDNAGSRPSPNESLVAVPYDETNSDTVVK